MASGVFSSGNQSVRRELTKLFGLRAALPILLRELAF